MTDATTVTVYSREDCHLCDEALATIHAVAGEAPVPVEIREVDVDEDPDLREAYGDRVPYVFVDGTPKFKYRVDESQLRLLLVE